MDKLILTLPSERAAKKAAEQAAYLANLANEVKALQSTLAMVTDKHVVEIKNMNTALTSKSKVIRKLEMKAEEVDNNTAVVVAKLVEKRDMLEESNAKLESECSKMHAQIQELSNERPLQPRKRSPNPIGSIIHCFVLASPSQ